MDKVLATILNENKSIITDIEALIKKIADMMTDKTEKYFTEITDLVNDYVKIDAYLHSIEESKIVSYYFNCINGVEVSMHIIDKIYNTIQKLINKTQSGDVYLSQSYVTETLELHKKLVIVYNKYNNTNKLNVQNLIAQIAQAEVAAIPDIINSSAEIHKYMSDIFTLITKYPFAIDLYCQIISALLKLISSDPEKKILYFDILAQIEADKDRILGLTQRDISKKVKSSALLLNPYYNIFGLIPNTDSVEINEISQKIFNLPASSFDEFVKICKVQEYGLIVINKHITHPITYNTNHLLNFTKSRDFALQHKPTYGVDIPLLQRYSTIGKIPAKNKWNFSIDTYVLTFRDYSKEKDKFMVILDSLSPSYYRIMTNYLSPSNRFFVRISSARELYNYCSNTDKLLPTRMNNFNTISINKALPHIYSPVKVDMEKLKEVSAIIDPKYLRNQIYLRLLERFKEILAKKYKGGSAITDNYTYASIIHDDDFLNIFSNIIMEEFHTFLYSTYTDYISGFINIAEIFSSFLADIYIYQRTFVKQIHDYFKDNLINFDAENPPNFIVAHFDKMVQNALGKIITPDSNLYKNVLYKINMLKNTLL